MFCSIYLITNSVNQKVYVGQTWMGIEKRFADHKSDRDSNQYSKLHRAMRKHGKDNFYIQLLTVANTQETADYWEVYFIAKYDSLRSGYNIRAGGNHGRHSEATKTKMRKPKPDGFGDKASAWMRSRWEKDTSETRRKMSESAKKRVERDGPPGRRVWSDR